jgi:hypothetical protein
MIISLNKSKEEHPSKFMSSSSTGDIPRTYKKRNKSFKSNLNKIGFR